MPSGPRMLILSCSQRKWQDPGLMPALERYDGPLFRVLRKYFRDTDKRTAIIYILSAKYGLIPSHRPIPYYDKKMTFHIAAQLREAVSATFTSVLRTEEPDELFISLGNTYLFAIEGYKDLVPYKLEVTVSEGSLGRRQTQLHDWLYGLELQPKNIAYKGQAKIRGVIVKHTREQVLNVARDGLACGQGEPTRFQSWFVPVGEHRVSPKWLVGQLSGLPVSAFVTTEALRVLAQLGVKVCRV